jgi:glucose-6-phosphate 1-epimerase
LHIAAVLNPWEKRAKAIPDLDKKEYRKFVCVVPARIENSITLKPNMEWTGMQELRAVSSTCYSGLLDPHSPVRNDD